MARWPPFIGPSGKLRSVNANAERTINWYQEAPDAGTPATAAQLVGTPGVRPWLRAVDGLEASTLGAAPVRGLFQQDGRAWAVAGELLYELFPGHTARSRGVVAVDGRPVTFSSNGSAGGQLLITSAGHGYVYVLSTNVLTEIADTDFPTPVAMACFLDGYFVALKAHSRQFKISTLEDGTSWNGLDVGEVSESSDNLLALLADHRELWLWGSQHSAVWYDNGAAGFPFAPMPGGGFIEAGIGAPFSACQFDNAVIWLEADARGNGMVRRAEGYVPKRVSSHALEEALRKGAARGARLEQAIGWTYQEAGHLFYVLYVPGLETTWVLDAATQQWHERAIWDPVNARWHPDVGRCHCFAFATHLVGDRASGAIYEMGLELYDYELLLDYPDIPNLTPPDPCATAPVAAPTGLSYVLHGPAGSTTRIVKFSGWNDHGEGPLSAALTITDGPATLSYSNYLEVKFSGLAPCAEHYTVYDATSGTARRLDGTGYYTGLNPGPGAPNGSGGAFTVQGYLYTGEDAPGAAYPTH